jgi:hypothetical protein
VKHTWILAALIVAAALAFSGGCNRKGATGDSSAAPNNDAQSAAAAQDNEAVELLKDPKSAEAREWLSPAHAAHAGFKMSKSAMLELANKLYGAGAKKVWCTGIESIGQSDVCALFEVELPDDAASRQAILKLDDDLEGADTPTKDQGGKYLKVALD